MGDKQQKLFRKLNVVIAALLALGALWMVLDAPVLLAGVTLAGTATAAVLLGRELGSGQT